MISGSLARSGSSSSRPEPYDSYEVETPEPDLFGYGAEELFDACEAEHLEHVLAIPGCMWVIGHQLVL